MTTFANQHSQNNIRDRLVSIPGSDCALPKYKFKNTLQSSLLDILIQEDSYVGFRTLFDILSKYQIFIFILFIFYFIYLF